MLAGAQGFAPAGATRGLSVRPLDSFGHILIEKFASGESLPFFASVWFLIMLHARFACLQI